MPQIAALAACLTCNRFVPLGATVCPRCSAKGLGERCFVVSEQEAFVQGLDELQRLRAMKERLLAWADQLDANRDKPGDVGKFIAAELRNRIAGN